MNDTYDPSLDHPEHAAPDPPEPRKPGDVLREGADHAVDSINDALYWLLHDAPMEAMHNPRIRSAEGFMRAAELMLDRAMEELGPAPTTTDEGNES